MNTNDLNKIRKELVYEANSYFENAYKKALKVKNSELSIIYNMHKSISQLERAWNSIIENTAHNKTLRIIPIFVHQYPQVNFKFTYKRKKISKAIEFGDLLYIHTDLSKNANGDFNKTEQTALLLQAKVNSNKKLDKKQIRLYSKWPDFKFVNSKMQGNHPDFRIGTNGNSHKGAKYLFIENRQKVITSGLGERFYNLEVSEPLQNDIKMSNTLADDLVNLLDFSAGKKISINNHLADDWSKSIGVVNRWATGEFSKNKKIKLYKNEPREKLLNLFSPTPNSVISKHHLDIPLGEKVYPSDLKFDFNYDKELFIIVHILTIDKVYKG